MVIKLTGETAKVSNLGQTDINRCFELMSLHYDNVSLDRFINDFREKKWVILLRNSERHIQGFSTQTLLNLNVNGQEVKGIFSGDTIIHKDYWGELELARIWADLVFPLATRFPNHDCYWFLISKGYKTYKFLPTYFNTFYPRFDRETPDFEKKLIDTFGLTKFPESYQPETGLVKFNGTRDYLKHDVADVTEKRLKNPHIAFFTIKNPGYLLGDELVCVAKINTENMKPIVHRYFLKGRV